jgi:hypothetical protein
MNVISGPADRFRHAATSPHRSAQIGMQTIPPWLDNVRTPVFSAKDHVIMKA